MYHPFDNAKLQDERVILWSIVAFWVLHLVILGISAHVSSGAPIGLTARRLPAALFAGILCYGIHLLLRPVRRHGSFARTALAATGLAAIGATLYGAFTTFLYFYGDPIGLKPIQEIGPYTISIIVEDAFIWIYSFFAWTAFYLALVYNFDVRERERRLAQVEALAHKAQVRALRYQINPHFLFNTLNALSSMIWERELHRAEDMLMSLSSFLRTTLEIDPSEDVTLVQEIALQKLYLEIEQIRFPDRLKVEIDLPADVHNARVPSLLLQPLVENAIKYGVASSKEPTTVRIAARRSNDGLTLEVEDDGKGSKAAGGTGVGLANVRQRLAARFGERWSFDAMPLTPRGFRVTLALPLDFA